VAGATGIGSTIIIMLVTESKFNKSGTKEVGFMGIDCGCTELDVGNLGNSTARVFNAGNFLESIIS